MLSQKIAGLIAAGTLATAVAIGAYVTVNPSIGSGATGIATAGPAATLAVNAAPSVPGRSGSGTQPPSNARSGPAAGGAFGTVSNVSATGFTVTTSAGAKETIVETTSTVYKNGSTHIAASSVTSGKHALVLGTTNSGTITATQVILSWRPTRSSSAAGVVPFQRGAPSTAKQAGQIPTNYRQGSGTIVSGTAANRATKAALALYPGGVIDRVVKLGNGEYEVHNIGVNWPHHIFVSPQFTVVGAN